MSPPRLLLIAVALCALEAVAGEPDAWFELTDGTVVTGELVGVDDNGFRVRSATLGEITIDTAAVRVMRRGPPERGTAPPAAPAPDGIGAASGGLDPGAVAAMQQRLSGDPEIMGMIMGLQNDPELTAALTDPALLKAILGGDPEALRNDPRIQRLMEHPSIRAIIERVGEP